MPTLTGDTTLIRPSVWIGGKLINFLSCVGLQTTETCEKVLANEDEIALLNDRKQRDLKYII